MAAPWQEYRNTPLRYASVGDSRAVLGVTRNTPTATSHDVSKVVTVWNSGTKSLNIGADRFALPQYYRQIYPVCAAAISGQTTTQLLARDQAAFTYDRCAISDAIDSGPDVTVLTVGINDFTTVTMGSYAGVVATAYGNVVLALQRLMSGVPWIIDEGDYGYSDGTAGTATDQAATRLALLACNAQRKAFAAQYPDRIAFVDWTGILCDASGAFLPGMADDGRHLSYAGQKVRSQTLARLIEKRYGKSAGARYSGYNYNTNAMMSLVSSGQAVNYTVAASVATVANKKVEVIDGRIWQTGEFTLAGSGSTCTINMPFDPSPTGAMAITSGSLWGFEFDVYLQGLNGATPTVQAAGLYAQARFVNAVGSGDVYINAASMQNAFQVPTSGIMVPAVLPPIQVDDVSANFTTASRFQLQVKSADTGVGLKVGVSNPRIVRLS